MTVMSTSAEQSVAQDAMDQKLQPAPAISSAEHPVLPIPFNLVIDGRTYNGQGLSLLGATAKGLPAPSLEGQRRLVVLQFTFHAYNVNLPVEASVDTVSSGTGLVEVRFVEPAGPHLASLRYLLNSYVAGDLVDIGGLLGAVGQDRKVARPNAKPQRRSMAATISQALRGVAVLALTAALAAIVTKGLYERFFVLEAQGLSHISAEGTTMRAITAGQIDYVNLAAKVGEPVVTIKSVGGDVVTLSMPCDCRIIPESATVGATVLAGDALLTLTPAESRPMVDATFSAAAAKAIARGAKTEIVLPDGRVAQAEAQILPASASSEADMISRVRLLPDATVTATDVGAPVTARVRRSPFAPLTAFLPTQVPELFDRELNNHE